MDSIWVCIKIEGPQKKQCGVLFVALYTNPRKRVPPKEKKIKTHIVDSLSPASVGGLSQS